MINHVIFPMFRMIIYIFKHLHIVLYQNNVIIIPKVFMYQFLVIWYKTILKLKQLQKSISCFTPKPPNWINMYLNYFCILVFNFVKLWRFYCISIKKSPAISFPFISSVVSTSPAPPSTAGTGTKPAEITAIRFISISFLFNVNYNTFWHLLYLVFSYSNFL